MLRPRFNKAGEAELEKALIQFENLNPSQAAAEVEKLEAQHGCRREWVWGRLGQAPLAIALEHLAELAGIAKQGVSGSTESMVESIRGRPA